MGKLAPSYSATQLRKEIKQMREELHLLPDATPKLGRLITEHFDMRTIARLEEEIRRKDAAIESLKTFAREGWKENPSPTMLLKKVALLESLLAMYIQEQN